MKTVTQLYPELRAAEVAILAYVRKHKRVDVSTMWADLRGAHDEGDCRMALWSLLASNRLHAENDWAIRLKRKSDWMVED